MRKAKLKPDTRPRVHALRTAYTFWKHVDQRGPQECWPWTASCRNGRNRQYGQVRTACGKSLAAHRVAWEIANCELLGERVARHTCDNPICVNPAHIVAGTREDNVRDAKERGLYTGMVEKVRAPKLTEDDVRTIRELLADGQTQAGIARRYGVSDRAIRCILTGETWKGKGHAARA